MDIFLWGVLPYVTLGLLIGGTVWRYRYDKFGWTTRSSELYESRLLRIASPMFHYGILVVIVGHAIGLVIPESWTDAIGVSETLYHYGAGLFGIIAAVATLVGIALLIYRRRTTGPVFMATTRNDKLMYAVLVTALVAGTFITLIGTIDPHGPGVNYRQTVSPWFRSIFLLQPDIDAMNAAPMRFHVHVLIGMLLFCLVPFTRLVHMFTAPLHYLFRPYIVYRSRDQRTTPGNQPARRGWAPVGTKARDR
ncbi:respiratory nitrate reductase subunit gamma [Gordonia sp. ABSL11-1]|uniref:respiratory nitrate reductase subunit gamma n=1 Tax=Gordonia sp. ABSL11-1 TaxID=3053924 RepID=UPI002572D76D|nr:respiratory nitrate reductase subunit gamma [Gordonia sp. ABSL11-1]MDL9944933.1 respiratory nitrate reductase subunit gamma [Gordonia sp. ABSL11-1]